MTAVEADAPGRPDTLRALWLASRPATLGAAVVPVAVGAACAVATGTAVRWGAVLAALGSAMAIQIGTNFANDVFDAEKGADDGERLGPARAVASGWLSPWAMRVAMSLAFLVAALLGLLVVRSAGWPIAVLGLASIASGIAYTGGPYPLGYHGLGDVFVLGFFGFVAVCGTAFVGAGVVPTVAWLASVPVGALATTVLAVNNLRDRHGDARAGKRTLAVRLGRRGIEIEHVCLLVAAYGAPVILVATGLAGPAALLPLLTLPLALGARRALGAEGRALNGTLAAHARLLIAFGLLFAVGLAFS